ncbi:hypothetical protein BgiBS90_001536 [Biomphalaria glabrata]|nr:hypothetical protein BgiBS90_001536 [Biomphalaria glabrata]
MDSDLQIENIGQQNTISRVFPRKSNGKTNEDSPRNMKPQSDAELFDSYQLFGNHETQMSEGGEADLHRCLIDCTKHPGHSQFIPVGDFSLNHLPEGHRDVELYRLVKALADLTVRVDVRMTSPHRPEYWPNTEALYPFYSMRNSLNLRTGTGIVSDVNKFTDGYSDRVYGGQHDLDYVRCWCEKCQGSDSPSDVWWEIVVYTATHVVYDDIEGGYTSLRLFYDKERSPVVTIDKVSVEDADVRRDWCKLKYVTCDRSIGDKLKKMFIHCHDIRKKVYDKYRSFRDVDKLTFIVSHPHGCSKQISIGQWRDRLLVGERYSKFTYTTCTCPGSSGASVYCVGFTSFIGYSCGWLYQLVHSGSLNSELNFSGASYVE